MSGTLGIRESEITKEIDLRQVGSICLSCGRGQKMSAAPARYFPPIEWDLSFRGVSGAEALGLPVVA